MRRFVLVLSTLTLPLLMSCGGAGGTDVGTNPPKAPAGTSGNSTSTAVSVGNDFFSPSSTTVAVGSTITWTWNSSGVAHDIVFNDGSVSSGVMNAGTFSHTFSKAGTYAYHCSIHGAAMSGAIVVQ